MEISEHERDALFQLDPAPSKTYDVGKFIECFGLVTFTRLKHLRLIEHSLCWIWVSEIGQEVLNQK